MEFRTRAGFALGLLSLLAGGVCYAQDSRARLQGRVIDASKAVIVGAKVSLLNVNQGVETTRNSNESGAFVFDYVDPGTYTITVEAQGFRKFIQQNVLVQTRGDVTVDAELQVGTATQTVEVTEAPAALQFNTATRDLTIDNKMVKELPLFTRNPFKLAGLDPAIVNTSGNEQSPYHHWAAQQVDTGGNTSLRNDILIDGTPVETGPKTAYTPSVDAVAEFTVQQNSVDAEFGHSGGGIMSVAMKSGSNEIHGTGYYLGRNPRFNALSDRTQVPPSKNRVRNHVLGGTLGAPIKKNKLFNFVAYESWKTVQPVPLTRTMITDPQREGDFSRTLTTAGALKPIYDPWTTVFNAAQNTAKRTPFAGNIIPKSRFDPTSAKILPSVWKPNNPGVNVTGQDNFQVDAARDYDYWNLSDRADWYINEKLKVFGRYSQFHTVVAEKNLSGNDSVWWPYDAGSLRHGLNIAGDAVYTASASTVINVRGSFNSMADQYDGGPTQVDQSFLANLWPSKWYTPYYVDNIPQVLAPRFDIENSGQFARGNYWWQHPKSYSIHGRVSRYANTHYLKAGLELRGALGKSVRPDPMRFTFNRALTADTYISPNTNLSGDAWASFLLGAMADGSASSYARYVPMQMARFKYWAGYFQDDFKLSQRITLNLGLRYEYETGPYDPEDRVPRYLDVNAPIPEMQGAGAPKIPADVAAMMKTPYKFNGAWYFADSSHRTMWNAPKNAVLPRAGIAYRVNDKTAIRAGYARFAVPALLLATNNVGDSLGSMYMPGFNADTYPLPVLEGIPSARLSEPFNTANPLILPVGKKYGAYTGLGGDLRWSYQDLKLSVNDRLNLSFQHEIWNQIVVDVTYFRNWGANMGIELPLNQRDPSLDYTYKADLSTKINNPFYQYLTPEKYPGQLRNQPSVTKADLLKTYPQYGVLSQQNSPYVGNRYSALQVRVQRPFAKGYNLLVAYNYNREQNEGFFNSDDQYARQFTWLETTRPRHRISGAGVFEMPFGKGRSWLKDMHPVLEAIVGGWQVSSIISYQNGNLLTFGQMEVSGDPRQGFTKSNDKWFNTSVFARSIAYTKRVNPRDYTGLRGPGWFSWDGTLSKLFPIKERFRLELRTEFYNVDNRLVLADPNTDVLNTTFGRAYRPLSNTFGRQLQYSLRLMF